MRFAACSRVLVVLVTLAALAADYSMYWP